MNDLNSNADIALLLRRHGIEPVLPLLVEELTGGVSSRVLRVWTAQGDVIVKQALPTLRVAGEWHADVARAQTEARFAAVLSELVPGANPSVLATDPETHAFIMEAAPADSIPWKQALLAGDVDLDIARQTGTLLGDLHRRAAGRSELAEQFADTSAFRALRLEPFFDVPAAVHPDLRPRIQEISESLSGEGSTLVHGDASPKNVLVTPKGTALLIDHEVAHWGSPAFDTAFVLHHLCLKSFYRPGYATKYHRAAHALLDTYSAAAGNVGGETEQTALILAPLLLARVDGLSPAEYLDEAQREHVRRIARKLILDRFPLDEMLERVLTASQR